MKEEHRLAIVIDGIFLLERGTGFVVFGSSGHQAAPEPSIVFFMEALWPVSVSLQGPFLAGDAYMEWPPYRSSGLRAGDRHI